MGECDENENNEVTDDHGVNTGENNGGKITKNYEEIINKVSVSYKNELTSSSGKIVENEIYKSDTVKINSDDDNIETVGCSERVEISICKLEREYEENYFVNIGQRVKFPQVYCEPRCLQRFLKGKSPLEENNVFSSSPLIFSKCFYDLVPSVWNDRKSTKWCYDER